MLTFSIFKEILPHLNGIIYTLKPWPGNSGYSPNFQAWGKLYRKDERDISNGLLEICSTLIFCLLYEIGCVHSLFTMMRGDLGSSAWEVLLALEGWASPSSAHTRRCLHVWEIEPLEFSWRSEYPLVKMGQISLNRSRLFCHLPSLLSVSPRTQPSVHSLGYIHFSPCLLRQWTQFLSTSVSLVSPRLTCPGLSHSIQ